MSIHSAVHGSLKKLTDKGEGGVTNEKIHSHHVEIMDDGSMLHSIRHKGKKGEDEFGGKEERHMHKNMSQCASCMKGMHP
jgi:hypothetical protein